MGAKIEVLENDITFLKEKKKEIDVEIAMDETEKDQLVAQKAALNVDHQILLLTKDLNNEAEKRDRKKSISQDYTKLTTRLGLHPTNTQLPFHEHFRLIHT